MVQLRMIKCSINLILEKVIRVRLTHAMKEQLAYLHDCTADFPSQKNYRQP